MQCDCVVLNGLQLRRWFNKTTELSKLRGWHLHRDEHLPVQYSIPLSLSRIKHLPIAANAVEGLVTTAVPKCPSQAPGDTIAAQAKSIQMLVAGWILLKFLASDFCTLHDYEIAFWTQGVSPRLPRYQCSSCYELALVAVFGKTASATPPDIYLTSFYMGVLLGLPLY